MLVNKKLNRLRHWAGEKMGGEVKTSQSDEFKALETEMGIRQEGMEKLHKSMSTYVKSLSKRNENEEKDKDKNTPIAQLGAVAINHGDDFDEESEFGQCLMTFGRANEDIARIQDNYVSAATSTWLESLERSIAQMKEYQTARKKLEQRRLAYDTSQAKMQKAKKDDYRLEEEHRSQKAKYDESQDDVYRRMLDIKEAEAMSVEDLSAFVDAELNYYDQARDVLLQLRADFPSQACNSAPLNNNRSNTPSISHRTRASTITNTSPNRSNLDTSSRNSSVSIPSRPRVVSAQTFSTSTSVQNSPMRDRFDIRPGIARATTAFNSTNDRDGGLSPNTESFSSSSQGRSYTPGGLKPIKTRTSPSYDQRYNETDEVDERSDTGGRFDSANSAGNSGSRTSPGYNYNYDRNGGGGDGNYEREDYKKSGGDDVRSSSTRRAAPPPPPPPPSRSKKPPPPLPMKRSLTTAVDEGY